MDDFNWEAWGAEHWADVYARRSFNGTEKDLIFKRDNGRCRYCSKKLSRKSAEFDHIVPFSIGGPTTLENGALSCSPCNRRKWANSDEEIDVAALFFRRVVKNVEWDDLENGEQIKYWHLMR